LALEQELEFNGVDMAHRQEHAIGGDDHIESTLGDLNNLISDATIVDTTHDHNGGDGAQIDHGTLAGLADDDHPQYVTHSELDASGYTTEAVITDHGALTGLDDDDHPQYVTHSELDASGYYIAGNDLDLSSADLELPQASPAAPNADGEVELDMTDGTLVIQNSSSHWALASSDDVVYGKMIRSKSATIIEPDRLQAISDALPMFPIEAHEFPHGIVIDEVFVKSSSTDPMTIGIENWSDPSGTITSEIVSVTVSGVYEASDTPTGSDGIIENDEIIMINLDTTDVDWVNITVLYHELSSPPE